MGKWTLLLGLAAAALTAAACASDVPPSGDGLPSLSPAPTTAIPGSTAVDDPVLADLRDRPPILPEVDVMDGCPVSSPQRINGASLSALGGEPLFAGGLSHITNWNETISIDGGRYLEVNWLSEPAYTRSLLVQGANLASSAPIEFRTPDGVMDELLYLTTATSTDGTLGPGYRTWAAQIRIPEPGCYGIQVEAFDHIGGYVIVFEVR